MCGGGHVAAALAATVAAPRLSWEIDMTHRRSHNPKQQATPKQSWHCQHIEEEEEPFCIHSPSQFVGGH